jgi:hypothetical protein
MNLTFNRINVKSGSFPLIKYVLGGMILMIIIALLIIGEFLALIVPAVFILLFYLLFKLIESEKIVFKRDEVQEIQFGKVKKSISYNEIVEIIGYESGSSVIKLLSNEKAEGPVHNNFRGTYSERIHLDNLPQKSSKHGFKFIIISKEKLPDKTNVQKLVYNKKVIVMHYHQQAYDFLKEKNLI